MFFSRQHKESLYKFLRSVFFTLPIGKSLKDAIRTPAKIFLSRLMQIDYGKWIKLFDTLSEADQKAILTHISEWSHQPLFSILMFTRNTSPSILKKTIRSLQQQLYPQWELHLIVGGTTTLHIQAVIESCAKNDSRIIFSHMRLDDVESLALNRILEASNGKYFFIIDQSDLLPKHALYWVAAEILLHPSVELLYTDEDKITAKGNRWAPCFKPDWNPDLFLSHNMISRLCIYKKERVLSLGGFRLEFNGGHEYDLMLRVTHGLSKDLIRHIPAVLYHRYLNCRDPKHELFGSESTAKESISQLVVKDYLEKNNIPAILESLPEYPESQRIRYLLPKKIPLVTIIIPTRDGCEILKYCIESIYSVTRYPNFEIIVVDNESSDPETLSYLESLKSRNRARILRYPHPFNYSAINNYAVRHARGEVICLLNNDTEMVSPDWLEEMVAQSLRPGIGAVGAKLLYPDGRVQHAGVIMGIAGMVGHSFIFLGRNDPGYCGRAILPQNLTAVTGACIVVQKKLYEEVGGMEEEYLKVSFNDIDFCLRLIAAGYLNTWTPYAVIIHHESITRGRDVSPEKKNRALKELKYMLTQWGTQMSVDPAYNPNLSVDEFAGSFQLAWPPRTEKPWLT